MEVRIDHQRNVSQRSEIDRVRTDKHYHGAWERYIETGLEGDTVRGTPGKEIGGAFTDNIESKA